MPNKTKRRTNEPPAYKFSDERTKRKIKRHLNDINDVITDKDIKEAKVPGTEPGARTVTPQKPNNNGLQNGNVVDDVPGNPATPWDILHQ
jgi:hypothetical protein